MVKNNNFIKGLMAAMLVASPLAGATEYPASDFQPKVVFNDPDYKHAESAPSKAASSKKVVKADPRYPAANFEPKVLYKDSGYKHKADVAAAPKASSSVSASSSEAAATAEEGSDNTMLFGLIALAAVGFFFFRKGGATAPAPARSTRSAAPVYRAEEGGLTGVAKYLADKEVKVTGVARYLESKEQAEPTTGVAKYMAKQVVAARQAAAERVTGVEKYLRNKG